MSVMTEARYKEAIYQGRKHPDAVPDDIAQRLCREWGVSPTEKQRRTILAHVKRGQMVGRAMQ